MATQQRTTPTESGRHPLDFLFHPRSVAVAGVSPPQPGFGGVAVGFLLALKEMGCPAIYPVNPSHEEIEGLKCYPNLAAIDGPVDHVISSVPARAVPSLLEDCIAKGVRSLRLFTAGFSETGEDADAELEASIVRRAREAGIRLVGPNCMGIYAPAGGLAFNPGFPKEAGPVGFISQSGGNAADMIHTSAPRGVRYSKAVSYGNAADVDESELLDYLAEDPETEIVCAYIEGVKDGRPFLEAMRKAAAAKPTIVLKGGRTEAGTRAVHSHTGALAGSMRVFDGLLRQVNAVRADSVEEMVDLAVAFRWARDLSGPGVAVVGGGGGFSVFAADELDEAGLACPTLPEATQAAIREFTPIAGTSVRNPIDSIIVFDPARLGDTCRLAGQAENIHAVMFHTSFSFGGWRRSASWFNPETYRRDAVAALAEAQRACGKPVVVVLRPAINPEALEQTLAFQAQCAKQGMSVFPSIPRAAGALAKVLHWREGRAAAT